MHILLGLLLALFCLAPWPLFAAGPPVADLERFPQDALAYVAPHRLDDPVLAPARREQLAAALAGQWFAPWERLRADIPVADMTWGFGAFWGRTLYGENLRPLPPGWIESMYAAARPWAAGAIGEPAITLRPTVMRVFPTSRPAFYDPSLAGEGFPFDYMQNTALHPGTPLFLSHASAQGDFVFAQGPDASGFVPVQDVALADETFQSAWRGSGGMAALARDAVSVRGPFGEFLFHGRVGTLLPLVSHGDAGLVVLAPADDGSGHARAVAAALPPEAAGPWPLPMTYGRMARVMQEMLGAPYGWGGLFGRRDCSATIQDLFAAFGVPLPRNSRGQAQAYAWLPLAGMDDADKRSVLAMRAEPFATLLGMPGHVLLYLGEFQGENGGEAAVFHTFWGVKTREVSGAPGRAVVGATVITGLVPGSELPGFDPAASLLKRLDSMTFVGSPRSSRCPAGY